MSITLESKFTEAEARELTEELKGDYGSLQVKISTAWQGRIWLALGYESWQDYLDEEFRDVSLRPPKDLEDQVIGELRAAGMSVRGIAAATDISKSTIDRRVADAGVPNGTPESTARAGEPEGTPAAPAPVIGLDGKSYQPQRPTPPADRSEDIVDAEVIVEESWRMTGQGPDTDRLASDLGIEPITVTMTGTDAPLSGAHIVRVVNELHAGTRAPLPLVKKKSKLLEQAFATGLANSDQFELEQITDLGQDVADTVAVLTDLLTAMDSSGPSVRSVLTDQDTAGSMRKAVKNLSMITGDRS